MKRTKLCKAVLAALPLAAMGTLGVAATASAQSTTDAQGKQQAKTLQAVVVTGSHMRHVTLATSNPVITVTQQQIAATGDLTVGAIIKDLPAITGGMQTPTLNNGGGSGATLVGLRGLGPSRTLVLIDGNRVVNKDLNSIPTIAIQRIEVLTAGASAVYGSDAIGGVINIILRKQYQGAKFAASYGVSGRGDAARRGVSFMLGQTTDHGSLMAAFSYNKTDALLASRRDFAKNALSLTGTVNGGVKSVIGGSTFAARDFIAVSPSLAARFGCMSGNRLSLNKDAFTATNQPTTAGDYHCFGNSDKYNYAAVNFILTPQERTNGVIRGIYHLADNINFFATVLHNQTTSRNQLAPPLMGTFTIGGLVISKDSYYNPFGVDFSRETGNLFRERLVPVGPRSRHESTKTTQGTIGLRGHLNVLNRRWTWDVKYTYGHVSNVNTWFHLPNAQKFLPGLGPSFLNSDGVVQCGTATDPIPLSACTPWDAFNLRSPSAKAVLPSASQPGLINNYRRMTIQRADAAGGLFDLPAGTVHLAVGIQRRTEYRHTVVDPVLTLDPATATCTLGSQCSAPLHGGFTVKEAYAEVLFPLVKELPGIHSLNLTLGDRQSKYSTFGSTNNWKVGLAWRPTQDLLVRGTVSTVFRAPNILELFKQPGSEAPILTSDPCDFIAPTPTTPNPHAGNPACVGVPATGTFIDQFVASHQQINAIASGSKFAGFQLGPETGKSFDLGVVYSPRFISGLTLKADFWRIYLNDVITPVGSQTVLNLCFSGRSKFCPLISRVQNGATAGQPATFIQPTANLGRIDVKGTDFSARYQLPTFSFGQFHVGLNATYLTQFKIQTAPGLAANMVVEGAGVMGTQGTALQASCPTAPGVLCFFPRIRAKGVVGWRLGPWGAQWRMRYISSFSVPAEIQTGMDIQGIDHYGSYIYNNLTLSYEIEPLNTRINVGVNNVFDKQPPMLFANRSQNDNTDPMDFDVLGRYYWARVSVSF